jgi:predicted GNAT family acetyltransferase
VDVDVQNHARSRALRSTGRLRVGGFTVRYDADWSSPYANYAIPDDGAAPTAADLAALVAAFRERDRLPRLEYLPACAPEVEPALLAAGFVVENRAAVMVCTAETLVMPSVPAGIAIRELGADADPDLRRAATVQHLGYGGTGSVPDSQVGWLRGTAGCGGAVALAVTDEGVPVCSGVCSPPLDGLGELAGLAVEAGHRRRGIGAAVAAHLTAAALARGCRAVWLEPGDPDIQRIYERIGYRVVGEKLNISLPQA